MRKEAFTLLREMEDTWWYRGRTAVIRTALARTNQQKVTRALDFGAGYGGGAAILAEYAHEVDAFEPDVHASTELSGRPYAKVYRTRDAALTQSTDFIGMFDVLEHIEDDSAVLAALHASLAKGGRVAITVPAFQFLWSEHDVTHQHFRRYTTRRLRRLLESEGYRIDYLSYWNMTLFLPAALVRLCGKAGSRSLLMPTTLNDMFYLIVRIECSCMRMLSAPFGTGIIAVATKR